MAGHPGRARDRGHGSARGSQSATATMSAAIQPRRVEESALRAAVSERLGESKFGLWFGDGVELQLSGDGEALQVRVPDEFFRDWIRRHYTSSLMEAAEAVAGRPLSLSIEVQDPDRGERRVAGAEKRESPALAPPGPRPSPAAPGRDAATA